jgi:hypothetical protein
MNQKERNRRVSEGLRLSWAARKADPDFSLRQEIFKQRRKTSLLSGMGERYETARTRLVALVEELRAKLRLK